ncbi:glycosyltransferase family 2 protein [Maridesulfovibrio zosterae]|uniref:glycosyltransferase family 2 protein n=1 Tax=Maridesulfovibrio zosterae TaxID=82171 RepID=UPI0004282EBC|nr:glycosyltransferase family A protein [Maridesulfovibrio zosterae]
MIINPEKLKPEVSVIIPTFNRADKIIGAVESVLEQSFLNFECIVIDDGSSDNTLEKLGELHDSRLKIISQKNKGVSSARNNAIAVSNAGVIALLDSDDEWLPSKLEKQLIFMEETGLHISQTDEIWIRNGKRVNQCKKHEKSEGLFFERSLVMCMVSPSCVMFTRKFWDSVGPFDENMVACEDYDLWLRGFEYPVGLLRERLTVKHGGREDQLSNNVSCLDLYRMYSIAKLVRSGKLDGKDRALALNELQRKSGYFAGGCRKRGKLDQADKIEQLVDSVIKGLDINPISFIE